MRRVASITVHDESVASKAASPVLLVVATTQTHLDRIVADIGTNILGNLPKPKDEWVASSFHNVGGYHHVALVVQTAILVAAGFVEDVRYSYIKADG